MFNIANRGERKVSRANVLYVVNDARKPITKKKWSIGLERSVEVPV